MMSPLGLCPELLHQIFSYIIANSTLRSSLLTSRAFHSIAEPILYANLAFHVAAPECTSPLCRFLDQLDDRRAAFVKHLSITIVDAREFRGSEATCTADIECLLRKLAPNLRSFALADMRPNSVLQLFDPCHPLLPPTLTKLQTMTRSYPDETQFALFLSCNGKSIVHLETLLYGRSDHIPPAYALSPQALPSLHILAAYSIDTIFRNLSGHRDLTHLRLGSSQGLDPNVASDLQKYASQLTSVATFACSLQHPEISQLAAMLPNLERLDVRIVAPQNIDYLMGDGSGV
ncbi:hypothetical protein EYR40_008420 [Pleurotus pulmonarius]|nr:hypothetical protein EYR40_008420 [Pleurotus pulmonarius]